jgi:type III pantothenate kinase
MRPDVVVDIGNTRVKWGRCARGGVAEVAAFGHDDPVGWKRQAELWGVAAGASWAVAGVVPAAVARFREWLAGRAAAVVPITSDLFDHGPMAIVTRVDEPDLVGVDRLLGALAAAVRTPKGASAVAVAVGTAMTVDFVTADGDHVGGAILPGPALMARSLHEHTAKLPRVEIDPVVPARAWGTNTEEAIELGIASAVLGAADQLVWDWAAGRPEPPWVYVTGGDAGYFRGFAFTADLAGVVIDPALTLDGLRLAAEALP